MTILERSDLRLLKVSQGGLANAGTCSTRTALHHLGYESLEPSAPQFSGSVGHAALEAWLTGRSADQAVQLFEERYTPWAEAHASDVDDRLDPRNCAKILRVYMSRKADGALGWRPLKVEEPFEVPIDDHTHLIGVFDVRAVGLSGLGQGEDLVVEHKFTGRISSIWTEGYSHDPQITAYWFAHRSKYPERKLFSVVMNAIEFSKLPVSDRNCPEHGRPLSYCYQMGTHARFQQFLTTRTPEQIASWRDNAIYLAAKYRRVVTKYDTLEKASAAPQEGMFVKGIDIGCRGCKFRSYCWADRPVKNWAQHMSLNPPPTAGREPFARSGLYDN